MVLLGLRHNHGAHFSFLSNDINTLCSRFGRVETVSVFTYPAKSSSFSVPFALVAFRDEAGIEPTLEALHDYVIPALGTLIAREVREDTAGSIIKEMYEGFALESGSKSNSNFWVARIELVNLFGAEDFNVTQAVLGKDNKNIHYILEKVEEKVAVGLKGVPANDAPVQERLHMAIQSNSKPHFESAVDMAEDLLQAVCTQYVRYCVNENIPLATNTGFIRHLYAGSDGNLVYVGQCERPKLWLNDVPAELLYQPPGLMFRKPDQKSQPQPQQQQYRRNGRQRRYTPENYN